MSSSRSRDALERELDFLRKRRLVDGFAAVANNVVRYGGLVGIAYFLVTRPVEALAGKITFADIALFVRVAFKEHGWPWWVYGLPWLFAVIGIGYGWIQRKLRRDTVQSLQGRIQILETARDAGRTSSTLTTRGDTREEDKI